MTKEQREKIKTYIINRPQAMRPVRHGFEFAATALGWVIWCFALRPIAVFILWVCGVKIFYMQMIYLKGYKTLQEHSFFYGGIIVGFYLLMRGWNLYNYFRFHNKERRKGVREISVSDQDLFFHLPAGSASTLHGWREIEVQFPVGDVISVTRQRAANAERIQGKFIPS